MFKNGPFFRKKSSGSLPDLSSQSPSTNSLKTKAAKLFGRAWNALAYGRWFGELPALKDSNSLLWILGNSYSILQKDDFRFDYASRIWLSYREHFRPFNESKNVGSDFGWGCTLRSAQMLVAQALMIEKFGREWIRLDVTPSNLVNILRLFEDCESAPLGLHTLMSIAKKLEFKDPIGKWYSPSQAFILLRHAIDQSHSTMLNHIRICLGIDNCVATREIIEISDGWLKNVLVVIPLRLGTEKVNEIYHDHLRTLFQMPSFMGFVGGRPKHAVYFIGCVENTLVHLDPHICQKYVELDGKESEEHWETFHCKTIFSMSFKDMDSSCALGFLLKSPHELEEFVDFLSKSGIADNNTGNSSGNSLFSIVPERPVYDSSLLPNSSSYTEDNDFEMM